MLSETDARFQYKEAGPQLLLQAFPQRIVNGGGRIKREYGLGRMRTDLLVIWPDTEKTQKIVIECKILHKSLEQTLLQGLEQTWAYMDRCAADEGHLIVFDRTVEKSWQDKLFCRQKRDRAPISVYGGCKGKDEYPIRNTQCAGTAAASTLSFVR